MTSIHDPKTFFVDSSDHGANENYSKSMIKQNGTLSTIHINKPVYENLDRQVAFFYEFSGKMEVTGNISFTKGYHITKSSTYATCVTADSSKNMKLLEVGFKLKPNILEVKYLRVFQYREDYELPIIYNIEQGKIISKTHSIPLEIITPVEKVHDNKTTIAIWDTGINYNLPEMQSRIAFNMADEFDGIDNDMNGYIDDFIGVNIANDNRLKDNLPADIGNNFFDYKYHGTAVASSIFSSIVEGSVISLIPVRILSNGATSVKPLETITSALDYTFKRNASIVNLSGGFKIGDGEKSTYLSLLKKYEESILIVAAAGNLGVDTKYSNEFPNSLTTNNLINVAGGLNEKINELPYQHIDRELYMNGELISKGDETFSSNYGIETVDVVAPGVDIKVLTALGYYTRATGSSLSAPYVAGLAAELKHKKKWLLPTDIKKIICFTTDYFEDLKDKIKFGGVVNPERARAVTNIYENSNNNEIEKIIEDQWKKELGAKLGKERMKFLKERWNK